MVVNLLNRRELILTQSMERQAEIRSILSANGIDYLIKTINLPNQWGHRSSLGIHSDCTYEYKIYVHKKDYEKADYLIKQSNRRGEYLMKLIRETTRVYARNEEGKLIAEITFPMTAPGVYTIDHTFVDPSLRGQGAADQLVRAALEQIQENGGRVEATCSYAVRWLEQHPQIS